jgi:hypothetical protein
LFTKSRTPKNRKVLKKDIVSVNKKSNPLTIPYINEKTKRKKSSNNTRRKSVSILGFHNKYVIAKTIKAPSFK